MRLTMGIMGIVSLISALSMGVGLQPIHSLVPTPTVANEVGEIAFTSGRDGNLEIYLMNADGTAQRNLTNNETSDQNPAWSPDGTQIAFETYRDGSWEIWVMDADGSHQRNLTNHPAEDITPTWSPDGSKIAFVWLSVLRGRSTARPRQAVESAVPHARLFAGSH